MRTHSIPTQSATTAPVANGPSLTEILEDLKRHIEQKNIQYDRKKSLADLLQLHEIEVLIKVDQLLERLRRASSIQSQGILFLEILEEYKNYLLTTAFSFTETPLFVGHHAFKQCCRLFYDESQCEAFIEREMQDDPKRSRLSVKKPTTNLDFNTIVSPHELINDFKSSWFNQLSATEQDFCLTIIVASYWYQYRKIQITYDYITHELLKYGMPLTRLLSTCSDQNEKNAVQTRVIETYRNKPSQITTFNNFELVVEFSDDSQKIALYRERKEQLLLWFIQNRSRFTEIIAVLNSQQSSWFNQLSATGQDFCLGIILASYWYQYRKVKTTTLAICDNITYELLKYGMPITRLLSTCSDQNEKHAVQTRVIETCRNNPSQITTFDNFKLVVKFSNDSEKMELYKARKEQLALWFIQNRSRFAEIIAVLNSQQRQNFLIYLCKRNLIPINGYDEFNRYWSQLQDQEYNLFYEYCERRENLSILVENLPIKCIEELFSRLSEKNQKSFLTILDKKFTEQIPQSLTTHDKPPYYFEDCQKFILFLQTTPLQLRSLLLNKIAEKKLFRQCIQSSDQFTAAWKMLSSTEDKTILYDACCEYFPVWDKNYPALINGASADFVRKYTIEYGLDSIKTATYISQLAEKNGAAFKNPQYYQTPTQIRVGLYGKQFNLQKYLSIFPENTRQKFLQSNLKTYWPCVKQWADDEKYDFSITEFSGIPIKPLLFQYLKDFLIIYNMLREMQNNLFFSKTDRWAQEEWQKTILNNTQEDIELRYNNDEMAKKYSCPKLAEYIDMVYRHADDNPHSRTAQALTLLEELYQNQESPDAKGTLLKQALITAHKNSHPLAATRLQHKKSISEEDNVGTYEYRKPLWFVKSDKLALFLNNKSISPNEGNSAGAELNKTYLNTLSLFATKGPRHSPTPAPEQNPTTLTAVSV